MPGIKVIYQDKFVSITDVSITIKKYYFPLGTAKVIIFSDMKKISIEDAEKINHFWGISTHCLNNWFHMDSGRAKKTKFLCIQLKNDRIKPSVTPQDVDKAFDALRNHFSQIERRSVMFESNRGKETELAHGQAEEMAKAVEQSSEQHLHKSNEVKIENID